MSVIGHPYANARIGLATIHAKELAVAPPFRRLLDAEVVVAHGLDTDALGTFSGEVPRPDALVETCVIKAELAFRSLDVDCAIANEGSYGPIDRVPLVASGVEIMAFIDRKRGLRLIETLGTHRTNWRLRRFKAGDPNVPAVVKAMGFPRFGVFVISSSDPSRPVKDLSNMDEVVAAVNREARRSDEGLAIVIADMRANRNPTRMRVLRALSWKLAKRLRAALSEMPYAGLRPDRRAPRPALRVLRPAHALGRFRDRRLLGVRPRRARPRKDGRKTAPKLSCRGCIAQALRPPCRPERPIAIRPLGAGGVAFRGCRPGALAAGQDFSSAKATADGSAAGLSKPRPMFQATPAVTASRARPTATPPCSSSAATPTSISSMAAGSR